VWRYLLFSFELCPALTLERSGRSGQRRQRTCYFLLNYAQHTLKSCVQGRLTGFLLFSFELCVPCTHVTRSARGVRRYANTLAIFFWIMPAHQAGSRAGCRVAGSCYFLLNYAFRRFPSLGHTMALWTSIFSACYFLLNYAWRACKQDGNNTVMAIPKLAIFFWIMREKITAVARSDVVVFRVLLFSFELCPQPRPF